MRLSRLAALGFILVALPIGVQAEENSAVHVFASNACIKQPVPCVENAGTVDPAQWAAVGSACVTETIGASNPTGFINETAGVDSSGCLTPKQDSLIMGLGKTHLTPRCCIKKSPENVCFVYCEILQ